MSDSMERNVDRRLSRRQFMKVAGAGTVAASVGPAFIVPGRAKAQQKTLRILQWNHFVPGYDKWFNGTYVKEWGAKNNTNVIVDNIGIGGLNARGAAEVRARQGHDLFLYLWPPPVHEDQVIDHREIYEEVQRKHGKPIDLAVKSTYNPKTKKYYGFSDSYVPDPINYRKDLWDAVGMKPDTWDDIRIGGAKIKKQFGNPIGIGLASEIDTNMALRAIMFAFGSSVHDVNANPVLNSKYTLEAVKFVKALYEETMTPEVFSWDASANNRFMLAGKGSLALNAISITRTGENKKIAVVDNIWLAKAAEGPVRRIGLEHVMNVYVIWKFAKNIDGAKQFLVDYMGDFRRGFMASEYYNFPCFPSTVPDIKQLLAHDSKAKPADKYKVLEDVETWATNVGYPGYANAAIDEVFNTWVVSTMFAKAAQGALSPEAAVSEAGKRVDRIFKKWKARGKI